MSARKLSRVATNAIGLLAALFFAFPVYWMFISALKTTNEIQTYVPIFIPTPTLENFRTAIGKEFFTTYLTNSLVVTFVTVILATVVGLLAAATVARAKIRGRRGFLLLVAIAQMAPFEALLIPYYLVLRDAGLDNQLPGLIVVYFISTLPFTIWSLRGFVQGIPIDLEEAAQVDGASRLGAFLRVSLPLLAPGLVATSIFCFITAWNEYVYANALMYDNAHYTLPVWLASFTRSFGTDWGGTMAASTLFTLPVLVFFLIVQKKMVSGLTAGAVKG